MGKFGRQAKAKKRAGLKGTLFKRIDGREGGGIGPPCPRCERPTVRWVHSREWRPEPHTSYYTEWYECAARDCKTRQIMPSQFMVSPREPILDDIAAYEAHLRDIMEMP